MSQFFQTAQGAFGSPVTVPNGGTGDATLTAHGVLIGEGTSPVAVTTPGTNGQALLGSTGADPVFATLTSTGGTITFTTGAGTLNIESTAAVDFIWNDVTGATQTLAVKNGYVTDRSGGVAYTLPATAAFGDEIAIAGKLGSWSVAQNANQQILINSQSSTVGITGSISSTGTGDCVNLLCITSGASTIWRVINSQGSITVV